MYYSAAVAALSSYGAATQLPRHSIVWTIARVLLDSAGALFALYAATIIGLLLLGRVMRSRFAGN